VSDEVVVVGKHFQLAIADFRLSILDLMGCRTLRVIGAGVDNGQYQADGETA
jgi:hypothetical protein